MIKRFLFTLICSIILCVSVNAAEYYTPQKDLIQTCTFVFTNITGVSAPPASCSGNGCNGDCIMDMRGAWTIQYNWSPNAITHTATDWDVEAWVTDSPTGQLRYYTDMFTNGDALAAIGDATSQYDVTNPTGNIFRYTYDTTGTDPGITATNPVPGSAVFIGGFAAANNGSFTVYNSGTNYVEVFNASGVAETNVTDTLYIGTNVTGSDGLTTGHNYGQPRISENGALIGDVSVIVTTTKSKK